MLDCAGRPQTDYYKLVVESESRQEWESLIEQIRTEIERFRQVRQPGVAVSHTHPPPPPPHCRPCRKRWTEIERGSG
eukprot:scaffold8287_cov51-Isochrysis_galbana.AAC.1